MLKDISKKVLFRGMIHQNLLQDGIQKGVDSVHILDGRTEHSILLEIFTNSGIGTMITH